MKLLFFIQALIGGGAERVLCLITKDLSERGYDVTVATSLRNKAYPLGEKVHVIDTDKLYHFCKGTTLFAKVQRRFNLLLFDKSIARRVLRIAEPDIVITFTGNHLNQLINLCSGRYPLVDSEHTTFDRDDLSHSMVALRDELLIHCDKVTILSEHDAKFLGDKLPQKVVMPNPLAFDPLLEDEFRSHFFERKNILACGSIDRYWVKGFDNLLKAFSLIADKYPGWSLDIAGTGSPEKMKILKDLCDEYHIAGRVNFLGFCRNMKEVMSRHSIFVFSSRHEGFGMVLAEAMAAGCASISFDVVAGPNEIIKQDEDGILVDNQNIEALAQAISMLILDENKRYDLGLHAINNIKRYSLKNISDRWDAMFMELFRNWTVSL